GRRPGDVPEDLPRCGGVSRSREALDLDLSRPRQYVLRHDAAKTTASGGSRRARLHEGRVGVLGARSGPLASPVARVVAQGARSAPAVRLRALRGRRVHAPRDRRHPRGSRGDLQGAPLRGPSRPSEEALSRRRPRRGARMNAPVCRKFEKALSKGEEAVLALEAHAAECADCREALRIWKEMEEAAPTLRKSWESPHLFPAIARAIAAEKVKAEREREAPEPKKRRFAWVPVAAAASLFVLSMIGLYVFQPGEAPRDPLARPSFREEALPGEQTLQEA